MTGAKSTSAKPRGALGAIALLFVLTGAACDSHGEDDPFGGVLTPTPLRVGDNERFDAAAAALRSCTDLTLHEGLPHRLFERATFEDERSAKSTEVRHGEFFYVAPIPIGLTDVEAICAVLSDPSGFAERDPDVAKLCGGFHADYAVTWSASGAPYEMHVCFGCNEANLYTTSGLVSLDLISVPDSAKAILKDFRAQRPPRW
jgi:hypothetical protein